MLGLLTSLTNSTVTSRADAKSSLVRRKIHLLFLGSLKKRPGSSSSVTEIRLVPAVAHLLHHRLLRILSDHLLVGALHVPSRGLHLTHGHPLLALRRAACVQNARLRPLFLVLDGVVWLWHLNRLLLHTSLPDLVIIIILHLILLNHLIGLVPLRRRLLQALVLYVRVLDNNF